SSHLPRIWIGALCVVWPVTKAIEEALMTNTSFQIGCCAASRCIRAESHYQMGASSCTADIRSDAASGATVYWRQRLRPPSARCSAEQATKFLPSYASLIPHYSTNGCAYSLSSAT